MRHPARFVVAVALLGTTPALGGPPAQADATPPVISEFMASNLATILDEDGDASDWIELHNPGTTPVDLTGWHLTDNAGNLAKWTLPALTLAPGEHRVVFASNKDRDAGELHTNFALGAGGEYLALTDTQGTVVHEYAPAFPAQTVDVSYGIGVDGDVGFLAHPSPGEANPPAAAGVVAEPALSVPGGYHDMPLSVTASSATTGASLRYTLDGSLPSASNGTDYTGPILLEGSTVLRVVALRDGWSTSRAATATYLVIGEVLAQGATTPPGWPSSPVNEQVFAYGFDQATVSAHRDELIAALTQGPTLSLVTDQANLTDPQTGIYVNPRSSGSQWERPVSAELFDGDAGFQIDAGLRIKGGHSRDPVNPKHSLRLTFKPGYEGALNYPLFGDDPFGQDGPETFRSIDLRSEQNLSWHRGDARATMLREVWARDAQVAIGRPGTRSRWVHVFLNGQYWGVYMFVDKVDGDFAAAAFGGSPGDYDVLEHGDDMTYEIESGDDDEWRDLWEVIADLEVTDDEFALVSSLVDLPNLADLLLLNAYLCNLDGVPNYFADAELSNNWFAVRGDERPFRFYMWDAELAMGGFVRRVDGDCRYEAVVGAANEHFNLEHFNPAWLHQVLMTRLDYRMMVREEATRLAGDAGPLGAQAALERWTVRKEQVTPFVWAELARWGVSEAAAHDFGTWEEEVAWVEEEWFPVRTAWFRHHLAVDTLLAAPIDAAAHHGPLPAVRIGPPG